MPVRVVNAGVFSLLRLPPKSSPGRVHPLDASHPPLSTALQVNASDTRGKSDASVLKGVGGKLANAVKELSTNRAVSYDKEGRRKKVGGHCCSHAACSTLA